MTQPTPSDCLLGIDVGTTSVSGVCLDAADGTVVASATHAHAADVPGLPPGCHEQDPGLLLAAADAVLRELTSAAPGAITAIALTGQMHGIVLVDDRLDPLTNAITWRDQRTARAARPTHAHGGETGCGLHAGYGGLTLSHLRATNTPLPRFQCALSVPGFIAARWTGVCAIDATLAASWGVFDLQTRDWHDGLLTDLDIPRAHLPPVLDDGATLGKMRTTNVKLSDALVFNPLGDNQAGVAAAGTHEAGQAVVNVGTSSQLSVFTASPDPCPPAETRPFPLRGFIHCFAALCGGWSYAYLARLFQQIAADVTGQTPPMDQVYASMARMAGASPVDAAGLQVDTRFAGDRTGGETQTGAISGITATNLTGPNLVRGLLNGIASELHQISQPVWSQIRNIALIGNGVRNNPLLREAFHNQFQRPCTMVDAPEAAAMGAVRIIMASHPHG